MKILWKSDENPARLSNILDQSNSVGTHNICHSDLHISVSQQFLTFMQWRFLGPCQISMMENSKNSLTIFAKNYIIGVWRRPKYTSDRYETHSETYSKPCQTAKMECFAKIVNSLLLWQMLHLRSLAGLWIRICHSHFQRIRLPSGCNTYHHNP